MIDTIYWLVRKETEKKSKYIFFAAASVLALNTLCIVGAKHLGSFPAAIVDQLQYIYVTMVTLATGFSILW